MVIVETSIFTRQVQDLLSDDEYRNLQISLAKRPDAGAPVNGSSAGLLRRHVGGGSENHPSLRHRKRRDRRRYRTRRRLASSGRRHNRPDAVSNSVVYERPAMSR